MTLTKLFRKNAIEANEEWPEIINGQVGEVIRVKTQTRPPAEPKRIALTAVSADDLRSIKKEDPFLYYSIPGVRSAKLLGQEVDINNLGTSRFSSCLVQGRPVQPAQTAIRSRCISFECHPDLLFEDIMDNLSIEEGDKDEKKKMMRKR